MVAAYSGLDDQPLLGHGKLSVNLQWAYLASASLVVAAYLGVAWLGLVTMRHHKH